MTLVEEPVRRIHWQLCIRPRPLEGQTVVLIEGAVYLKTPRWDLFWANRSRRATWLLVKTHWLHSKASFLDFARPYCIWWRLRTRLLGMVSSILKPEGYKRGCWRNRLYLKRIFTRRLLLSLYAVLSRWANPWRCKTYAGRVNTLCWLCLLDWGDGATITLRWLWHYRVNNGLHEVSTDVLVARFAIFKFLRCA